MGRLKKKAKRKARRCRRCDRLQEAVALLEKTEKDRQGRESTLQAVHNRTAHEIAAMQARIDQAIEALMGSPRGNGHALMSLDPTGNRSAAAEKAMIRGMLRERSG